MNDATAASAAADLDAALSRILTTARKSIAYDQGVRNGAACKKSLWKPTSPFTFEAHIAHGNGGANENISGLIRQYLPEGTNLSAHSQEELDEIAFDLNMCPRKRFDFKCPIEVMSELIAKHPLTIQ